MPATLDILLLRPRERSAPLVRALTERGHGVRVHPAIELHPLAVGPAQRARIQALDHYDALIFVSPTAASLGLEQLSACWPQWPRLPRWFAVGAATADALGDAVAAGIALQVPERNDSEGLLALPALAAGAGERALIGCGVGGRELLEHTLEARGWRVERLELYERRPQPAPAAATLAAVDLVVATSVQIVEVLAGWVDRPQTLRLLVNSARAGAAARRLGFVDVVESATPDSAGLLRAIDALGPPNRPPGAVAVPSA